MRVFGIGIEHALYRHTGSRRRVCSIESDTDPTRLSPDNVTTVIAVLCVDNQVERVGNADLALDLEICAFARHFANQAVDSRAIKRDRSSL
jgi:hypothetical protein